MREWCVLVVVFFEPHSSQKLLKGADSKRGGNPGFFKGKRDGHTGLAFFFFWTNLVFQLSLVFIVDKRVKRGWFLVPRCRGVLFLAGHPPPCIWLKGSARPNKPFPPPDDFLLASLRNSPTGYTTTCPQPVW